MLFFFCIFVDILLNTWLKNNNYILKVTIIKVFNPGSIIKYTPFLLKKKNVNKYK
jgi:hypothetical protein